MTEELQNVPINKALFDDDDRLHRPDADRTWRESYYFSFFDAASGIGGFTSIGRRPESGHIGSINVVWGPDRPTLVASELGLSDGHELPYEVRGLTYDCAEPFGAWRLTFTGGLNDGGSDVVVSADAIGAAGDAAVSVTYDLVFTPDSPAYSYEQRPEWAPLFTGHIDQTGTVTGTLVIDGTTIEVDGRGAKDHSWGVRDWYAPLEWRWVDLVAGGTGPEIALWRATFDGSEWVGDGALFNPGGSTDRMTSYDEHYATTPRAEKDLPTSWRMTAATDQGSLSFDGEVVRLCPVVFGGRRFRSWNDRALVIGTTGDGRTAYANVEFSARVAADAP